MKIKKKHEKKELNLNYKTLKYKKINLNQKLSMTQVKLQSRYLTTIFKKSNQTFVRHKSFPLNL